jgi:hypothetical protein
MSATASFDMPSEIAVVRSIRPYLTTMEVDMPRAAEQEYAHIGETPGIRDHDHDLVHELSTRLDALWRYDQFIANAEDKQHLQEFWRELKRQDRSVVDQLKQLIAEEVRGDCF